MSTSSVYNLTEETIFCVDHLAMYTKNSNSARTVPWGTPEDT